MTTLTTAAVPNFPNGGLSYEQRYQNELNNILRLYLQRDRDTLNSLVGVVGGQFLQFPHIAASDANNQYATATNTPTKVLWTTEESGVGFTLNPDSTATPDQTGIYKITFSLQFANDANTAHDAVVWLRLNGNDVANSATSFTIPARKSAGVPSYVCGYSEATFTITTDDKVALYWATDQAATSGGVLGVYMLSAPAQTVPYARPSIPSAIGSITFVSRLP